MGQVSAVATPVSGLTSGVAMISLGGETACAITSSGEVRCWGSNASEQLANPRTSFCGSAVDPNPCSPTPLPIGALAEAFPSCGRTTGWCAQQSSQHMLCEDFDQGFPGQLTRQTSAGSSVQEDDGDYQSAPRSMIATTSATSPLNVESTAWGTFTSPKAGASFQLQADFKVGSDCFSNVEKAVTIARVDYPDANYSIAYSVRAALGAGFVMEVGESESTPQTPGPLGPGVTSISFPPADHWATLTLSADLGAGGSTGGFSVTPIGGNAPTDAAGGGLTGPAQAPTSAPVLRIGADAATHGCTVHIDNVLFDVK